MFLRNYQYYKYTVLLNPQQDQEDSLLLMYSSVCRLEAKCFPNDILKKRGEKKAEKTLISNGKPDTHLCHFLHTSKQIKCVTHPLFSTSNHPLA